MSWQRSNERSPLSDDLQGLPVAPRPPRHHLDQRPERRRRRHTRELLRLQVDVGAVDERLHEELPLMVDGSVVANISSSLGSPAGAREGGE